MSRLVVALVALALHAPLHGVALAPVVLVAAGAVGWYLVDCLRWPDLFEPPTAPTYVRGFA